MANPFEVQLVNPLQALLLGQQSYNAGVENERKQALATARNDAAAALQSGDARSAISRLLSGGDWQGANAISTMDQNRVNSERNARLDARQISRDAQADKQWAATHALAQRTANRLDAAANETPLDKAEKRKSVLQANGIDPESEAGKRFIISGEYGGGNDLNAQVSAREGVAVKLGLERGSPAFNSYVATGKMGRDEGLTAGDRKVINEAEDELPNLQGTREALRRALELNSQTFSGAGANIRTKIGTNLPDLLVPDFIADKKTADATSEWQKIMGPEALQVMANTLKGATTDFELRKFTEMLADPTTKPEIRKSVIERLDRLAARKEELANRRINELKGGTYYKPQPKVTQQGGAITQDQYNALPSGSVFTAPDGTQRVKP